jgi:hypothetical protein
MDVRRRRYQVRKNYTVRSFLSSVRKQILIWLSDKRIARKFGQYQTSINEKCLMLVPCIIRRSRNNQHYALICTYPLLYILAPTCFGSSLPSLGSFLDPSELLEIQIE